MQKNLLLLQKNAKTAKKPLTSSWAQEMNRFEHKGQLEIPYMYSQVNFGETEETADWSEEKYNFLKFVLIGNQPKKNVAMSVQGPDRSEEQKIWSDDEISVDEIGEEQRPALGDILSNQAGPESGRISLESRQTLERLPVQAEAASAQVQTSQRSSLQSNPSHSLNIESALGDHLFTTMRNPSNNSNIIGSPLYEKISQFESPPSNFNSIDEVIVLGGEFIVARTQRGICFAYNRYTHKTFVVNKNEREQIKSTFLNEVNCSIFIVSVKQKNYMSKMQCRSVSFEDLKAGRTKGKKLFGKLTLQYPDFVEVDDLNRKVVTKHSQEKCFRVWDLGSYELQYVLYHDHLFEFKICNGVMLLMFDYINNIMPMTILDVETGKTIKSFSFEKEQDGAEFEFLEQYNEKLLVKYKDQPLKIIDVNTRELTTIPNFITPEAFIFIYEKEVFLSLKDGGIKLYSIEGNLITDFNQEVLYSQEPESDDNMQRKVYQLCLSDSRTKVLTVVKEKFLSHEEQEKVNRVNEERISQENPEDEDEDEPSRKRQRITENRDIFISKV